MGVVTFAGSSPWRWIVVLLAGAMLAGCGGGPTGSARAVAARLIEDDPQRQFDRGSMVESETEFEWVFRTDADLDGWESNVAPDEIAVSDDGLLLRPERQFVTITRQVELEAERIDALELHARGLRRHPVALEWAGPGEGFSKDRKVTLDRGQGEPVGFKVYRLVTAGHPQWRGPISRLRFSMTLPKTRRVVIDRIVGVVESVPPEGLAEVVGRAWKVELGHDLRNALLTVPGVPVHRTVTIPRGAELWLSYGLQPRLPGPVRFVATAVLPDGSRRTLLDERLTGSATGWHDAKIDLGRLAGKTVELELETGIDGDFSPELGFPVWANPEVVAATDELPPNLIVVSIDTLRADHMSLYGYQRTTSPHLDAWARSRGAVFERVVAAAPWTLPSHVSLFSGLDAVHHGVNLNRPAPPSMTLLSELLRPAGYSTLAVTGGGFVHPQFGFAQGFDRYWSYGIRMGSEQEVEDEVAEACAVLGSYSVRPFFLFLHTYEVHNPFRPRQPYFSDFSAYPADAIVDVTDLPTTAEDGYQVHRGLVVQHSGESPQPLGGDQLDLALDLYDAGIAYTDSMIARVLRRLEHLGIEDRTVVVVTSDHGEMFGEHGEFNHVSLYDENLLVPLIIVDPRRPRPRRISYQVRLIDVMPTVLDLLDLNAPAGLDGVSLVPLLDGGKQSEEAGVAWSYAAASNRGVSVRDSNRLKYVARTVPWPFVGPVERLYDLAADPREEQGEPEPGPALEDLRRRTRRKLETDVPGVRIRIGGASSARSLSGELIADRYLAQRLKTLGPGCACLHVEGPGTRARFEIEAGTTVDLVADDVGPALTLRLDAAAGQPEPFVTTVDLETLQGVVRVVPAGDGWRVETADEPALEGVSLWWHRRWPGDTDGGAIDQALAEQLEALGYVQ